MKNPENYDEQNYEQIASQIKAMIEIDQDMREKNLSDDNYWDSEVDKKNTERMKEIVGKVGWPTISKVGDEVSSGAWLLVQHADHDPAFQRHCLNLMKAEPDGEVLKPNIALLEDRVLLVETGHQLYGTQFFEKDGHFVPKPIKDEESVEERRKDMGLDTLTHNIIRMEEKYRK